MVRRNYIFSTVRSVFELFGYQPIETPAMENLSTLLGKYGEEGDKLLFKILNSGNFLDGIQHPGSSIQDLTKHISEKGLRYDLTVPFARFVVQHQNELVFPFKRYQVQPVWRADRPQKGRYREFFQCDVDVIGTPSLLYEAELVQIIDEVFTRLDLGVTVHLNNRKILFGVAEAMGAADRFTDITVAIDKLDKAGIEVVTGELAGKGIPSEAIEKLIPMLMLDGKIKEKLGHLTGLFTDSETGRKGVEEMASVHDILKKLDLKNRWDLDLKLARGLNYYTGTIIEVKATEAKMGSLCGGGRYDDLTGIFGLPGMSGVGISFGADRIYDVIHELGRFPETITRTTRVLFANFGQEEALHSMSLIATLRKSGITSEIYPDASKMKKQLEYANRKNIPFVVLVGKEEMEKGVVTLKVMATGEQQTVGMEELIKTVTRDARLPARQA
jgi:histidyl-tRNA synthetase